MDLFKKRFQDERLHPIFKLLLEDRHAPERDVLTRWADEFVDRDGKFVDEFQLSFESAMWELYLHAVLKELGHRINLSYDAPDFVIDSPLKMCIEATIAKPADGGQPAFGFNALDDLPNNFNDFNHEATIRICNSISSKYRKYQDRYSKLPHTQGQPFVVALASFDRPYAHMAVNRPIMAALYGRYFDESRIYEEEGELFISQYHVVGAIKSNGKEVPLGLFLDNTHEDISAVIFSPVATWGKIRAMSNNQEIFTMFTTFYPPGSGLIPIIRKQSYSEYTEHLLDGLYIFHNPNAKFPLVAEAFNHERVAQFFIKPNGELEIISPTDFLLLRQLHSLSLKERDD